MKSLGPLPLEGYHPFCIYTHTQQQQLALLFIIKKKKKKPEETLSFGLLLCN